MDPSVGPTSLAPPNILIQRTRHGATPILDAPCELRTDKKAGTVAGGCTPLGEKLSVDQYFGILSLQLNGAQALET
ncbi:hypothetical protein BDW71DRAFT_189406 [Aspergillus fruticulosus]